MTERWLVVLFRCCPFALWFVEIIQHFPVLVYFLHTDVSLSHCWWYRWYIYVDVCLLPCLLEWSPAFASLEFFSPSSSVIVNTGAWHARKIFSPQNMQVTASSKTLMHFNKPVMRPKKTRKVRSFSRDESMASNDQRSSAVSLDLMHMKKTTQIHGKETAENDRKPSWSVRGQLLWSSISNQKFHLKLASQIQFLSRQGTTPRWHASFTCSGGCCLGQKIQLEYDGAYEKCISSWKSQPSQTVTEVSEEPWCSCHGMSIFFWTFIVHVVNLTKIG